MTITPKDHEDWLKQHIPHRVFASLIGLKLLSERLAARGADTAAKNLANYKSSGFAMHEGRHAAVRWLIEFIGICEDRNGTPQPCPKRFDSDLRITDLGGQAFPLTCTVNAGYLARIWKGCTQATSHPTHNSGHPPIDDPELDRALRIVFLHLEENLYKPNHVDMGI